MSETRSDHRSLKDELKMSGFSSPYQKVLLNLMFTGTWWENRVSEILKEHGLTEQQYNVLRILKGQKGSPLNLYMIQGRMLHRMSNATRIVEKLRLKGLVDRSICQENRRQVEISITEEGERMLERVEPDVKELHEELAQELSEGEAEELHRLLEKVRVPSRAPKKGT